VFADDGDRIWVGVHFGSRRFGHTIASAFLALGQGRQWGERVPETEVIFSLDSPLGHDYYHLMELAGRYAYAGREWVVRKVVDLIGGRELELVHNHHNFAWRETHYGEDYIVVRKGATPAFPGQMGFIGGWPGRVSPEMMHSWVREKGVILRGGGLDESPHVYRRLPEVLAAQGSTIEVLHTLRPLVVVMAGADVFDPYRD